MQVAHLREGDRFFRWHLTRVPKIHGVFLETICSCSPTLCPTSAASPEGVFSGWTWGASHILSIRREVPSGIGCGGRYTMEFGIIIQQTKTHWHGKWANSNPVSNLQQQLMRKHDWFLFSPLPCLSITRSRCMSVKGRKYQADIFKRCQENILQWRLLNVDSPCRLVALFGFEEHVKLKNANKTMESLGVNAPQ